MEEILISTSIFLIKALIVLLVMVFIISMIAALAAGSRRKILKTNAKITITPINKQLKEFKDKALDIILPKKLAKARRKQQKADDKAIQKGEQPAKKRLYVIDFKGDIKPSNVDYLKKEITLIESLIRPKDEVLVKIQSPGGSVTGYGQAAVELARLRRAKVSVTAAVDQIAASGGYLMACAANKIIAAPFAIVGSIGVIALAPNFYEFLKKKNIDFEVYTAGKNKKTITPFSKNTKEGIKQFKANLRRTHEIFKKFVASNRPDVKISEVAQGNWWHAEDALKLKLVDQILTSEDYLISKLKEFDVFEVKYEERIPIYVKTADGITHILKKLIREFPKTSQQAIN